MMNAIACQLDISWENPEANRTRIRQLLEGRPITAGSLLVLPEMFSTGFSMRVEHIRETDPSPTVSFLQALAREFGIFVMGGLVTVHPDGKGSNEAVIVSPDGQIVARYAKLHPFTFGQESVHYRAGESIVTFDWNGLAVAPFICYDLRFPEIFRRAVYAGAEAFAVIANWPSMRTEHWVTLLQARAIENQAYVIGVNRCGTDPQFTYPGRSLIIDPHGEIIADAGSEEKLVEALIHRETVADWRMRFPALQDMRAEFVGGAKC